MTQATHNFWLRVSAVIIAFFAPVLFLGTMPALNEPARLGLDLLTWPTDRFPPCAAPEIWFLLALTGGFSPGWGVTIRCLSLWVYDHPPEGVRRSLVTGACARFLLDSAGSIACGHPSNAGFNILVLRLIVGPMWHPAYDAHPDCPNPTEKD